MRRASRWILAAALVGACSVQDPTQSPEGVLREAFAALAEADWDRYERVSTTVAHLLQEETGTRQSNPFAERQSYAHLLKTEQREAQKQIFLQAASRGPGLIDFRNARFAGAGSVLDQGTLSGLSTPYTTYSIRIELNGESLDTRALYPRFVLVPWKDGWRLLALELP